MLNDEEKEQFKALLSMAVQPPKATMGLAEKLSAADIMRKWAWFILIGVILVGTEVEQRRKNSARISTLEHKMKEIRPLVRQHEWQVQQGLTNKDLKDRGITAPVFPEDE